MYCIYLRKSRADRDNPLWTETEVLHRHEQTLLELADNRGYKIGKIFREVVSGETLAARPQMQELLAEVEQGTWEGVLVMEIERLARGNSIDQGIVSQAFKYSNTLIVTPNKIYNPANEFDEEFFEFGLFMSRREYKTINRRLNAGRIASCKEGKYVGSIAPYGYKKVKLEGQKGYTLEPEPEEAEVIKLIFRLYTCENRIGTRLICKKLDAMGVKTRKGGKWSLPTVRDILRNDVYIGKIHWNKAKEVKTTINGAVVKSRPRQSKYDVYDGLHKPLIDLETFNKAQEYMSLNPPNPAIKTIANPIAGLVVCSVCGKKMIRRPHRKNNNAPDYLICSSPNCPNIGSPLYVVEQKILDGISIWLSQYAVQAENDKAQIELATNKDLINQIDKQIVKLNNRLSKTYELLEEGIYSKTIFVQRQKELSAEINKLQIEKDNLMEEDKQREYKQSLRDKLIPQALSLVESYNLAESPAEKNKILKNIFEKIIYTKTKSGRWDKTAIDNFTLEFVSKLD